MTITYQIETEDTILLADHAQTDPSDLNNRTRGDTATFDLYLPDLEQLVVANGETYTVSTNDVEIYAGVDNDGTLVIDGTLISRGTVDNDGTIDNNGTLITRDSIANNSQVQDLLRYDRHAGSYSLSNTLSNTQRYKERLPSSPNVSSLVVGLKPDPTLNNEHIAGKWGLISNVTDSRTRPLTNSVLTVEIDILADYSEYADVSAVQTDLEI